MHILYRSRGPERRERERQPFCSSLAWESINHDLAQIHGEKARHANATPRRDGDATVSALKNAKLPCYFCMLLHGTAVVRVVPTLSGKVARG